MFGIGGFELFIIVVFIFVIFGPDKLPEIIKLTGTGIKKFRKAKAEMDKVLQEEIVDPVMKVANEPDPPKKEDKPKEKKEDKPKEKKDDKPKVEKEVKSKETKQENKKETKAKTSAKKTTSKTTSKKKESPKKGGE